MEQLRASTTSHARSGIGNATLYRHFSTRDHLIEAEVEEFAAAERRLVATTPPLEALRA